MSIRFERLRLQKLSAGFSLIPHTVEVQSLTISLRFVLYCDFAFGSDGEWVCTTSRVDVHSLRTDVGGGGAMTDSVIRWLVERLLPGAPRASKAKEKINNDERYQTRAEV